jgi:hypothetical protein
MNRQRRKELQAVLITLQGCQDELARIAEAETEAVEALAESLQTAERAETAEECQDIEQELSDLCDRITILTTK